MHIDNKVTETQANIQIRCQIKWIKKASTNNHENLYHRAQDLIDYPC